MRTIVVADLSRGRHRNGRFATTDADGLNGAFEIMGPCGAALHIIASDGIDPVAENWEHVSVSIGRRPPNWQEMSFVKSLFWDDDECVVQFHPAKSDYINIHDHVLHLWRHRVLPFPMPPKILV